MKRDADLFGSDKCPIPPNCEVTIWSKGSEEYLSYKVPLIGIYDVDNICIQRFLEPRNTPGILYHTFNDCYNNYVVLILIESTSHPAKDSDTSHHTTIDISHTGYLELLFILYKL